MVVSQQEREEKMTPLSGIKLLLARPEKKVPVEKQAARALVVERYTGHRASFLRSLCDPEGRTRQGLHRNRFEEAFFLDLWGRARQLRRAAFEDHDHEWYEPADDPHELVNLANDVSRKGELRDHFNRLLEIELAELGDKAGHGGPA